MNKTEKNAGLVAGISLIVMAVAAGFSYGYVHNELVNESAEITRQHLIENKSLFMAGLAGWIVIFITDLVVSGSLYIFFRSGMRRISAITAGIRIIYSLMLGFAIWQLAGIIPLLQESGSAPEIALQLASFEKIWSAGLIVFGFHLLGLGYLSVKSTYVPGFFGYLLCIAGISYVLIHAATQFAIFSPDAISSVENIMALPMALGEILFAGWLIYKGLKN
jgi:hypothetical protein